jgi:hypothetical protein
MHLAVISEDLKQFIHTHPMSPMDHSDEHGYFNVFPEALAHGGEEDEHSEEESMPMMTDDHGVNFQAVFPEAGLYKAFVQFRPKGVNLATEDTLTAAFWLRVEEKAPLPLSPWWINLLWASAAIVLLGWGVKKYLRVKT